MSYCSHYPLTLINIHFHPRSSVVRTPVYFHYTAPSSLSRDAALFALDSILGSPVCKEKTGGAVWHSCCFRSCRGRFWGPVLQCTMPLARGWSRASLVARPCNRAYSSRRTRGLWLSSSSS